MVAQGLELCYTAVVNVMYTPDRRTGKMQKTSLCSAVSIAVLCLAVSVAAQELSPPEENFEYLWQTLDRNYAIFGPKHVDWNALYSVYRPRVTPATSDDELFEIMSDMLGHLNDNHVFISSDDPSRFFCAGYLSQVFSGRGLEVLDELKSTRPAPDSYFEAGLEEDKHGIFGYGWLTPEIGYVHFNQFTSVRHSSAVMDDIIAEFGNAKAIVVDVRRNVGGDDKVGKALADRFACSRRLYMTSQVRNGNAHDDFTPKKYWHVEPGGPIQFTGPVILLTDRTTISAGENFALAMRVLPNVTVVGDFTSGCFADMYMDELPNGWSVSVSYKLFLDHTGFCWEGIGVPPDLRVVGSDADFDEGKDRVLDLAIALAESGDLSPQDESEGIEAARSSLVAELGKEADERGMEAALELLRRLENTGFEGYAVDFDEMRALGGDLLESGNTEESIAIFTVLTREFPGAPEAFGSLGKAYWRSGQTNLAIEAFERAIAVNRRSYPWEVDEYRSTLLMQALFAEGYDAMERVYIKIRAEDPGAYNESVLNVLGYDLLYAGRTKDAINVFALNVETYPEYANGYDSLGEAYMKNGDNKRAIENYRKSLDLNPGNTNALEMLEKLETE
jgi:C-terminal processing protease CtpA/Prc/tetratricopeptide (TPR) repeat protein